MKANAKRGVISTRQLFYILFGVRLYSLLLDINSLTDFVLSFALSAVLCLIVIHINAEKRLSRILLGIISILLMLQTVLSYVIFTKIAVHPEFSVALLIVLILASVIYAASLKLEALARFSSFCVFVLISALIIAALTNLNAFNLKYLNALSFEIKGGLYNYVKCFDLPVIYALVSKRVNEKSTEALKRSLACSYAVSLVILLFCFCIMGTAANVYGYPSFTLFQLSRAGSFSRLDILFTGSMLLALFLKCSILLYCGILGIAGEKFEKN